MQLHETLDIVLVQPAAEHGHNRPHSFLVKVISWLCQELSLRDLGTCVTFYSDKHKIACFVSLYIAPNRDNPLGHLQALMDSEPDYFIDVVMLDPYDYVMQFSTPREREQRRPPFAEMW